MSTLDWNILYWIQDHIRSPFMDTIMPKITHLGDMGLIWILIAFFLLASKKYRVQGFIMLFAIGIGILCGNIVLKNLIQRSRPCWIDPSIKMLIPIPTDYSFPSGHTLASVIGATCLTMTNKKFGFFAIPLAILIAFSRLYLFVHFPSDILASVILGIVIAISTFKLSISLINKHFSSVLKENSLSKQLM